MKIKEISVKKLFGVFDHTISLNIQEGITLMLGENGFGKTAILKMINAFFNDVLYLKNLVFECFQIKFDDNSSLKIVKANNNTSMTLIEIKEGKIIREVPHFGFDPHGELRITKSFTEQVKLINIRLVETQRLLTINESEQNIYQATVTKYANELAEKIKSIMAQSMELAAHLDRSYPSRLAKNRKKYQNTSAAQLTNELNKLEEKRQLLHSVGLIDKEEDSGFLYSDSVDEFMIPVLMVYIDDSKQKLQIFDKLARKMKLFIEIINNRFLYKKISMDKERGFIFTSSITGKTIPATGLSSGEQHEFVLFFELLFKVQPHSLILIDEPEISLHLSWLKYFIEDLKEVIKLNEMELLIATHSPDIISNHWDLTVELEGLEEKQVEI